MFSLKVKYSFSMERVFNVIQIHKTIYRKYFWNYYYIFHNVTDYQYFQFENIKFNFSLHFKRSNHFSTSWFYLLFTRKCQQCPRAHMRCTQRHKTKSGVKPRTENAKICWKFPFSLTLTLTITSPYRGSIIFGISKL